MPQHFDALERANAFRSARAELKRAIQAGEIAVADILDPAAPLPEYLLTMRLSALLCAQHRVGVKRARVFLAALPGLPISEGRRLGELTERQRRVICEGLRETDIRVAA